MNKIIILFCLLLTSISTCMAQTEVKGITSRRVIYDGPQYWYDIEGGRDQYSTKYYGWEITNRTKYHVYVEVELWSQTYPNNSIVKTQDIMLKPGESYIFKREEHKCSHVKRHLMDSDYPITNYYIKTKAYKLE